MEKQTKTQIGQGEWGLGLNHLLYKSEIFRGMDTLDNTARHENSSLVLESLQNWGLLIIRKMGADSFLKE